MFRAMLEELVNGLEANHAPSGGPKVKQIEKARPMNIREAPRVSGVDTSASMAVLNCTFPSLHKASNEH